MRRRWVLLLILVVTTSVVGHATAGGPPDIAKASTKFAPLKAGPTYQASLFAPPIRVTLPDSKWLGGQWTNHGYDLIVLAWRPHGGGIMIISAPGSTQSAATTLHRLETERATGPAVGISIQPAVAVMVAGFRGRQFDGTVTGQYGHTFVPFSGQAGGASSTAGDHDRLGKGKAFRILVLNVRGKVIFFETDSDAPTQDPALVADATKIIHSLKFPNS
jgi:hypothetical protein